MGTIVFVFVMAGLAKMILEQLEEDAFLKKYPIEEFEDFFHE